MGAKKMSMHQTGFQEVLSSAQLTDDLPESLVLIGVQPELLDDFGGSLRDSVKRQIPAALALAREVLDQWDISYRMRDNAPTDDELVGPGALDMLGYEEGRPLPSGECR